MLAMFLFHIISIIILVIISHRLEIKDTFKSNNFIFWILNTKLLYMAKCSTLMNIITKIVSISYNYTINKNNNKILLEMQFLEIIILPIATYFLKIICGPLITPIKVFWIFYISQWNIKLSIVGFVTARRMNQVSNHFCPREWCELLYKLFLLLMTFHIFLHTYL